MPGNASEARLLCLVNFGDTSGKKSTVTPRWEDAKLCQKNFYFGDESVRKRPESRVWGDSLPRAAPPEVGPSEGEKRRSWAGGEDGASGDSDSQVLAVPAALAPGEC